MNFHAFLQGLESLNDLLGNGSVLMAGDVSSLLHRLSHCQHIRKDRFTTAAALHMEHGLGHLKKDVVKEALQPKR